MNGRDLTLGIVAGLAVAGLARNRSASLNNRGSVNGETLRNELLPAALRDTHDLVVTEIQKRTSHWEPTGVGNGVTSVPYRYHTLVATLYPKGERWKESRLGQVAATSERKRETPTPLRGRCADDLARLGGPDHAFSVTGAFVDERLRGKGAGQALYAALVEAAGAHGGALASNRCLTGTELTSADALRVWERLGRRYAVDATTLIATGADATTGLNAEARGDGYFSSLGTPGTDTAGGYAVGTWADASATESFALPDGEFVNALDVLAGRAALVDARSWPGLAPSALLIDAEGVVVAELAACETPRLVSRDTGYVESWCTAPLTRTTWTNDAGVWAAAETQSFADLDVSHIRVIETVD